MKNRIKEIRLSEGLSQDAFANRLGLKSRGKIANLEKGKTEPEKEFLDLICKTFNINIEWLENGTGEMHKDPDVDFGSICLKIGVNDEKAKKAIIDYYKLSDEDKKLFWNFVERFLKKSED